VKQQLFKSDTFNSDVPASNVQSSSRLQDNVSNYATDLTSIVHTVIRHIHTHGACNSTESQLQLKTQLPAYYTLNCSVIRGLLSRLAKMK